MTPDETAYFVATVDADGPPHIVSSKAFKTRTEAWAAVFHLDPAAEVFYRQWNKDPAAPYDDSVLQGSVHRWVLVVQP